MIKLVHKNESDHGLVSEVYHNTELRLYAAYVQSEYVGVDEAKTFGGRATLDDAKAWCAQVVSDACDAYGKDAACPFCGGQDSRVVQWSGDGGEFDAVECNGCSAGAPRDVWNRRAPC